MSTSANNQQHIPVLAAEVLEYLCITDNGVFIDGTVGLGGHTELILQQNPLYSVIGCDRDSQSLDIARERLLPYQSRIELLNMRFSKLPEILEQHPQRINIKGVLLDLGISSRQLDSSEYGISFAHTTAEQPLDMRLDPWCKQSASDILNTWSAKDLADLFFFQADYRPARRLAKLIVDNRPLHNLEHFIDLCKQATPYRSKIHPATLPMMALRIIVNEEYQEIRECLTNLINILEPEARISVISFHSGEDRIVKNLFKQLDKASIINKKVIVPTRDEIKKNPRARSAKMRVIQVK